MLAEVAAAAAVAASTNTNIQTSQLKENVLHT